MIKATFRPPGFTLLELLVSLSIFAIITVIAYNGLNHVLDVKAHNQNVLTRLADLQVAITRINQDFDHIINRSIRDESGTPIPPLTSQLSDPQILSLTRIGYPIPGDPKQPPYRVGYKIFDQQLIRVHWTVLDRAQDSQPIALSLIDQIRYIHFRFLDNQQEWHTSWPDTLNETAPFKFPLAIEMEIDLIDQGTITRLFKLPDTYANEG